MGTGRQPLSPEQKTDLSTLSNTLQCLLAEHGFTNEPIGGCPAGKNVNGFDSKQVSEIVQTVVAELHRRGLM
jgi:4-hydroxy-tetrahydrodipicolinate synthase